VALADSSGFDRHAWQLPWAMTPFLEIRGRYLEWAALERMAMAAATRLRDTAGLATSNRLLASAWTEAGDYALAFGHYKTSLARCSRGSATALARARRTCTLPC
jgi:hypothetical protein